LASLGIASRRTVFVVKGNAEVLNEGEKKMGALFIKRGGGQRTGGKERSFSKRKSPTTT